MSRLQVFVDNDCPLCRREVEFIRRQPGADTIELTDIGTVPEPPEGVDRDELMATIHARLPDGSFVTGPEVFRQIYQRLGYSRAVRWSRWPIVRSLLAVGYEIFARIRPHLPFRRRR